MATPAKRPRKPAHGRNRKAVEDMVAALRANGRMEAIDSARLVAAQALADAVDSEPTNASLWREYRAALETLRQAGDNGTDDFAALIAGLSAEVGDATKPRAGNARP
jgi:hypothetical protein